MEDSKKKLNVNPKFKDLIPALNDDEFAQLEKNILSDGEIMEPIVVWNGTIVDGHHRYEIAQRHPEIPFTVIEKEFDSENEAYLWICDNQLGRRNLTDKDRMYLLGAQAEMAEKVTGGTGANQYTKEQVSQNETPAKKPRGSTGEVAQKEHVGRATVNRAKQFKKGVDVADSISPGLGKEIRSGEKKVSKQTMEDLAKADLEVQEKIVQDIKEGKPKRDRKIHDPWTAEIIPAKGESCRTTTTLKKVAPGKATKQNPQEVCLNELRDICQSLDDGMQKFLEDYTGTDITSQSADETIIILNDMKEIVQKAIKEIGMESD